MLTIFDLQNDGTKDVQELILNILKFALPHSQPSAKGISKISITQSRIKFDKKENKYEENNTK